LNLIQDCVLGYNNMLFKLKNSNNYNVLTNIFNNKNKISLYKHIKFKKIINFIFRIYKKYLYRKPTYQVVKVILHWVYIV